MCTVPDFGVEDVADSALSHILNIYRGGWIHIWCQSTVAHWQIYFLPGTYFAARRFRNGETFRTQDEIKASTNDARRCRGKNLGLVGLGACVPV